MEKKRKEAAQEEAQEEDRATKAGLCWRCEHRARFHETGHRPRCECGDVTSSNWSCYMYRPVQPIVIQANDNVDPRPLGGPAFFSSRGHRVGMGDVKLVGRTTKQGLLQYWVPKEDLDGKVFSSGAKPARRKSARRKRTGRKLD